MLRLPATLARIVGVLHDVVKGHGAIWPESRLRASAAIWLPSCTLGATRGRFAGN